MHLPAVAAPGHPGSLPPQRVQRRGVVTAVADPYPCRSDGTPARRQQPDVLTGGQGDRHVAGHGHQRGVLLVRAQHHPRGQRVAQPLMRAVLPAATIHSSSRSCSSRIDHAAACPAFLPRRSTHEPAWPAAYWANRVATDPKLRSTAPLDRIVNYTRSTSRQLPELQAALVPGGVRVEEGTQQASVQLGGGRGKPPLAG
jgi:hypothetical protein